MFVLQAILNHLFAVQFSVLWLCFALVLMEDHLRVYLLELTLGLWIVCVQGQISFLWMIYVWLIVCSPVVTFVHSVTVDQHFFQLQFCGLDIMPGLDMALAVKAASVLDIFWPAPGVTFDLGRGADLGITFDLSISVRMPVAPKTYQEKVSFRATTSDSEMASAQCKSSSQDVVADLDTDFCRYAT